MAEQQRYIVTLHRMSVDRNRDETVVTRWSVVVPETSLKEISLDGAAAAIGLSIKDISDNLEPMTVAEIKDWRKDYNARIKRR